MIRHLLGDWTRLCCPLVLCCLGCHVCCVLPFRYIRAAVSACCERSSVTYEMVTAGWRRCLSKRSLILWKVALHIEIFPSDDCQDCMVSGKVLCMMVVQACFCSAGCPTLLFVLHNQKQTPPVSENENQAANLTPRKLCEATRRLERYLEETHIHHCSPCTCAAGVPTM